jgi:hypothetical protein
VPALRVIYPPGRATTGCNAIAAQLVAVICNHIAPNRTATKTSTKKFRGRGLFATIVPSFNFHIILISNGFV